MKVTILHTLIFLFVFMTLSVFAKELLASDDFREHSDFIQNPVQYMEAKVVIPAVPTIPTPVTSKFVPFGIGEKFEYDVGWGKINAGTVELTIKDVIDYEGYAVYQTIVNAESNKVFSLFYRVRDQLESLIDVNGIFSRRYWTKQDEAYEKLERKYEFDHENNMAEFRDKTYYIPYGIQDEVSAVFFVRTLDLEVGNPVYLDIFARRKSWRVKVDVLQKEEIEVPAGTFKTILIEPELHFDGIMKKGKIKVWMTDDQWRIPVQVKSKIAIGSITIKLKDYQLSPKLAKTID